MTGDDAAHGIEHPSEMRRLLGELETRDMREPRPKRLPKALKLTAITRCEPLFQPRELVEHHLSDLGTAIARGETLDPLMILQVGAEPFLVDGHHRWMAYSRAKVTGPVPVTYWPGSVREAVLHTGEENRKARLAMGPYQRQNMAWRLVLTDMFTKAGIAQASGASERNVATMRSVAKRLGAAAHECRDWLEALGRANATDKPGPRSDAEEADRLEAMAEEWADRLAKTFSTTMAQNPAIAARALEHHFGRKLPDLVQALMASVSKDDWETWRGEKDDNPDF